MQAREILGIRVISTRLRAAAEILELRAQLLDTAGSLEAALGMAATAAESVEADVTGELEQLGRRLHAGWVAIGHVEGRTFVVRAVWPAVPPTLRPGDRIDAGTGFIVEAVRAREAVTTARLVEGLRTLARLPEPVNHVIAIPLPSDGVVVAARSGADDAALDPQGLEIIQRLAAVALRISHGQAGESEPNTELMRA